MSTTVTYKGAEIASVENETKTLKTAGTWVEGDITLTDVTSGGGGSEDDLIECNPVALSNSNVTKVGDYAFYYQEFTSLYLPNVTDIGKNAFGYASGFTSLTDANFPNLTGKVGSYAFEHVTDLQTVNLTSALDFYNNGYAFSACTNLTDARFPNARTSQLYPSTQRIFSNCSRLVVCDLGKVGGIGIDTFTSCSALRTLILRSNAVVTLSNWRSRELGGIYQNPTASTIYVPSALISSYQTASNWSSAYSAGVTFAPIEGSEYEL